MSIKLKAFSGVYWSLIDQVGSRSIIFGISLILARLLMPEDFGLIAMLTIFMALGGVLISSGLTQSLLRTEYPDEKEIETILMD